MDISFDGPSAFFVPPPPEDGPSFDPLLFQSQLTQSQRSRPHGTAANSKATSSSFGAFQFEERADYDHDGVGLQKVPGTPTQVEMRASMPPAEDYRMSCANDIASISDTRADVQLRSVMELPERYCSVFPFPYFNIMQSKVFDEVMYSDRPLVVSAPTGSGKTTVFELAIVRVLMQLGDRGASNVKMVYVAPIKALCSEKCEEWRAKFGPLGLECIELTGDSEMEDFFELQKANIITTTPEKWDSMTRRWRDNKALIQLVRLFLIDEVHQLNDSTRGATVEAVVSRMKTVQSSLPTSQHHIQGVVSNSIRFLAISATIPNISDVAAWLGNEEEPATEFYIDESHRPVRLRKVVLGYPDSSSDFKFDLSLNYRLSGVIHTYSDDKPTLVFCATRKGTQQAAATLVKDARFVVNVQHKHKLFQVANSLRDSKLRDLVIYGVGYHHAGLEMADRKTVEAVFINGELPVLFCTSTLAMGVNLPAHLVVIKSTMQYVNSGFVEYGESQVLQMIGRAGRPQFDTSATAVIMTKNATKMKYDALINGSQVIESSLHTNLIEHLNAEVVLRTITDVSIALQWLKSTFLFVRIKQNPKHYGIPEHLSHSQLEEKLQDMCLKDLHLLEAHDLISMVDGFDVKPTEKGRLMAQYCVAFESARKFLRIKGTESVGELVSVLSVCPELSDLRLRVNEKRTLNALNSDKNRQTIRYPMNGKIKTADMKVNCLIQATLGCLPVQDFALNQDTQKIFRAVTRLSKCLMEYQLQGSSYRSLLSAVLCSKCLKARLWENSKHVAKQLDKIGVTLSTALVNAGITSFEAVLNSNPRELEMVLNKHPPFGNQLRESVSRLPSYHIRVVQTDARHPQSSQAELTLTVTLTNHAHLRETNVHFRSNQGAVLMVGDLANKVVFKAKIMDTLLLNEGQVVKSVSVSRQPQGDELEVHLVHMDYVGVDQSCKFTPVYSAPRLAHPRTPLASTPLHRGPKGEPSQSANSFSIGFEEYLDSEEEEETGNAPGKSAQPSKATIARKQCNHRCTNKRACGHECCKAGVVVAETRAEKRAPRSSTGASKRQQQQSATIDSFLDQLHFKAKDFPQTPAIKRFKISDPSPQNTPLENKFGYRKEFKPSFTPHPTPVCGPGGLPTPPVCGPGGLPTPPVCGPGGLPTPPVCGPGGLPTPPVCGPGGLPTPPVCGPGGLPTPPVCGPGGLPTPAFAMHKPMHHMSANRDQKDKGRTAGCYADSVDDAIDIDELFEGYETEDDSLVPDLDWELEPSKDFGSDSGLCLAAPTSPQMPTPVGAMRLSFNSPTAPWPSITSASDPSTSTPAWPSPQQAAVLPSPLQQGTHLIHTASYLHQPTKPFTQPFPTPATSRCFALKERISTPQTSAWSSTSTAISPADPALTLTTAKTPLHQKQSLAGSLALLHTPTSHQKQSLAGPLALLHTPTSHQKRPTFQVRNLVPTFNTFNAKPPTPVARQGESPAPIQSGTRMDPSTGQRTGKNKEGLPATTGLPHRVGVRDGDAFMSFFTSGPSLRSSTETADSHGMDDVFDGIL